MISYIRGYYVITVEGIEIERFLNHLIRNSIKIYNVNRVSPTKIEFCVEREDMKAFKQCYRGSNYDIKVKQKTGIPFILKRIYKLKGMWICAIISFGLLAMTSQFVTDIYIEVPEGIKKEEIMKELYNAGLKPGVYKKNIDRKEIRDELMLEFEEIAYVSINVKGTNVFVTVTKKAESLKGQEESNYCNIIAEKNGIIEKVIPRSGNPTVSPGDIVQTGDVLVSGANTQAVPEVWASTFYKVTKSASYEEIVKEETGNQKRVYTISFYDKEYTLRRKINYEDYTVDNKEYKLSIGEYTFPIKIKVSTFKETKDVKVQNDKEELKKDLEQQVLKELDYTIPASARITDAKHDYKVNGNMLEYTITAQTSEDIGKIYNLSKAESQQLVDDQLNQESEEPIPNNKEKRPIDDIRNEFEPKEDKEEDENTNDSQGN